MSTSSTPTGRTPRAGGARPWVLAFGLLAVVAAVVAALAGRSALSAADDLERAQGRLATATSGGAGTSEAVEALAAARTDVARAEQSLSGWPVDVVAAVPVLGRSWRAERAVTSTAQEVLSGAAVLASGLPEVGAAAGGVDLAALARVRSELAAPAERAVAAVQELQAADTRLTPPQVRDGVRSAQDRLGAAADTLRTTSEGLGVLSGVLGGSGPRTMLVMLQNNAELRGSGGYSASFALGRLEGGRLSLGPLRDVASVIDPPERARRVPAPEEYVEDFGAVAANTTNWRSWNFSPNVPDSALVAARIADVLLPEKPDLVLLLDVPALGELAGLGDGPIVLPDGSQVAPEELTQALLVDAYAAAGAGVTDQLARRAALQAAATTAVTRLVSGSVPAAQAGRTVARLATERHLALWSARPDEQAALVRLGAAGDVTPSEGGDLAHVSVNNIGSNKLDQYVERDVELEVGLTEQDASVVQRVRFTNSAPADLVPYVAGFERPGVVVSLVELSLPPTATLVAATVDGEPWTGTHRTGGDRQRLSTRVEIPRGDDVLLEMRYTLPVEDAYRLRIVPQPLVEDAHLRLTLGPGEGGYRLGEISGAPRSGGGVVESGDLVTTRDITVEVLPPVRSRWDRFQEWWSS